jgi:hypothetical protein
MAAAALKAVDALPHSPLGNGCSSMLRQSMLRQRRACVCIAAHRARVRAGGAALGAQPQSFSKHCCCIAGFSRRKQQRFGYLGYENWPSLAGYYTHQRMKDRRLPIAPSRIGSRPPYPSKDDGAHDPIRVRMRATFGASPVLGYRCSATACAATECRHDTAATWIRSYGRARVVTVTHSS